MTLIWVLVCSNHGRIRGRKWRYFGWQVSLQFTDPNLVWFGAKSVFNSRIQIMSGLVPIQSSIYDKNCGRVRRKISPIASVHFTLKFPFLQGQQRQIFGRVQTPISHWSSFQTKVRWRQTVILKWKIQMKLDGSQILVTHVLFLRAHCFVIQSLFVSV